MREVFPCGERSLRPYLSFSLGPGIQEAVPHKQSAPRATRKNHRGNVRFGLRYAVLALLKLWGAWRLRQLCSDSQRGDEASPLEGSEANRDPTAGSDFLCTFRHGVGKRDHLSYNQNPGR